MSEEIKDIMDALENNELKDDGFWGRACSRLSQQLQKAKKENEKLTHQNKQMMEALEKIAKTLDTIIRVDKLKYADDALSVELVYMQNIATQALAPQ